MKHRILLLSTLLIACFTFMACGDDEPANDGRPTVFGAMTFQPSNIVAPNDTVTAFVAYQDPGYHVYLQCHYTVKSLKDSLVTEGDINIYNPSKEPLFFGFRAPKVSGAYNVYIKTVHINYTSGGPGGTIYGPPTNASARLTVKEP